MVNMFSAEEMCNGFSGSSDPETIKRLLPCNSLLSLGLFDFGKKKCFKFDVHECVVTGVIEILAGTFLHVISTVNNKLSWVIMCHRSRIEDKIVQQFANLCFNTLNENSEER